MLTAQTLDPDMAQQELKPATTYIARAMPLRSGAGYYGVFALPGRLPEFVRSGDKPATFASDVEAEEAAGKALVYILTNRVVPGRGSPARAPKSDRAHASKSPQSRYTHLTGPEFSTLIGAAGVTPTFFAFLYGTSLARVYKWMDGVEDIPHPVRVLLETFKQFPATIDFAETVTNSVTTERAPRSGS